MPGGHRNEIATEVQGGVEDLINCYPPAQMLFGFNAKLVELLSVACKVAFVCPRQIMV